MMKGGGRLEESVANLDFDLEGNSPKGKYEFEGTSENKRDSSVKQGKEKKAAGMYYSEEEEEQEEESKDEGMIEQPK
jgi:hypothetical protein